MKRIQTLLFIGAFAFAAVGCNDADDRGDGTNNGMRTEEPTH